MAHIVKFTVRGLAGRKNPYCVDLDSKINIFFGTNGSGKTSLLKILNAAMENSSAGLLSIPFESAEVVLHSAADDTTFTRAIDKTQSSEYQEFVTAPTYADIQRRRPEIALARFAELEKSMRWTTTPPSSVTPLSHSYLPTTRLYSGFDPFEYSSFRSDMRATAISEEALEAHFAGRLGRIWQRYSAEILEAVRKVQADGLASILKLVLAGESPIGGPRPEVDPEVAYQSVTAFLQRQGSPGILGSEGEFRSRYSSRSTFRDVVGDIYNVEQQIELVMQPRNKLQRLINKLISGRKVVSLESNAISVETLDHRFLGLVSLSSGEKHVLRILFEALIAGSNTMIIDEPELSMHVDWQRELVSALSELNSECQMILATHSPEIMVGVDDSNIHRL